MKKHKLQTKWLGWQSWSGEKKLRIAGYASLGMLGLLSILALCPITSQKTQAAEPEVATVDVSLTAVSNISISVSPSVEMTAIVTDNAGEFISSSADLLVSNNDPNGYRLFMASANPGQTTLSDPEVTASAIESITENTIGKDMTGNVWGYNISFGSADETSTFKPIPANSNKSINAVFDPSPESGDRYKLNFGTHITKSLTPGTYTNSLIVSVVGNYKEPATDISDTVYMQEMTPEICKSMPEADTEGNNQYQLKDIRDEKIYSVAKLADGKCWMTQNLAYEFKQLNDDGSQRYLTPADSDVKSDWEIPTDALVMGQSLYNSVDSRHMWKGSTTYQTGDNVGQDSGWKEGDGNYYTFGAATAGTGASATAGGTKASSSICPKGWRLPTGGESGEFKKLVDTGGITVETITEAPYYFRGSGRVAMSSGNLSSVGSGHYWSSMAYSYHDSTYKDGTFAYSFDFGSARIDTISYSFRYLASSVRCVAK